MNALKLKISKKGIIFSPVCVWMGGHMFVSVSVLEKKLNKFLIE
jgi:hypothetical protein